MLRCVLINTIKWLFLFCCHSLVFLSTSSSPSHYLFPTTRFSFYCLLLTSPLSALLHTIFYSLLILLFISSSSPMPSFLLLLSLPIPHLTFLFSFFSSISTSSSSSTLPLFLVPTYHSSDPHPSFLTSLLLHTGRAGLTILNYPNAQTSTLLPLPSFGSSIKPILRKQF